MQMYAGCVNVREDVIAVGEEPREWKRERDGGVSVSYGETERIETKDNTGVPNR